MSRQDRVIAACLAGLILGLLCVGVVSRTPIRHLIQITPAAIALILLFRRLAWAKWAAAPVFAFWLLIMIGIWLFLLGLANIITGHYSPAEIALTLVIGLSSCAGLFAIFSSRPRGGVLRSLAAIALFGALEVGAMWVSLQPFVEKR